MERYTYEKTKQLRQCCTGKRWNCTHLYIRMVVRSIVVPRYHLSTVTPQHGSPPVTTADMRAAVDTAYTVARVGWWKAIILNPAPS